MHPLKVDHVRSNHLLSLASHLCVNLFGFGVVINLLLLFECFVGYVVQLLKMIFVMMIVAFLRHTDVLADRKLVASGRFHQEVCSFLVKLDLHQLDRLNQPALVLFDDLLHFRYSLSVLHEVWFFLVPCLIEILKVAKAHHFVDVGLLSAESLTVDPDLFKFPVYDLLDIRIIKPFGFAL